MSHGYRIAPSIWLATGAVTVGVGAALALGTGVAEADTGASGNASTGARAHHESRSPGPATKTAKSVGKAAPKSPAPKAQTLKLLTPQTSSQPAPRVSAAVPRAFQLQTPQMLIQQAINVVVPLMNNTPIRNLLDIIDPPAPGTSVVRLLGRPVSTTLSPDGTRAYVTTTATFGSIPILGSLVGSVSTVNVIDTTTNTIVGVPVVVRGRPFGFVVSPDGTRAFQPTYSSRSDTTTVTVIDPRTGAVIGTPVSVSGQSFSGLVLSPDSRRAYLSTITYAGPTSVTVIDTADGTLVGAPVQIEGFPHFGVTVSADSSRVAQVTQTNDGLTVTMIDPDTGGVVGDPLTIDDAQADSRTAAMFSQSGERISLVTIVSDPVTFVTSRVLTVFDTATGEVVGTPVVLPGSPIFDEEAVVPDPAGDRVYVVAADHDPVDGFTTHVTVVDTTTSTVVGGPTVIPGQYALGTLVVSADGKRVYQSINLSTGSGRSLSTVAVVDTDGQLVGEPTVVQGFATAPVTLSLDGSRAYQATRTAGMSVTAIDTTTGAVVGAPLTTQGLTNDPVLLTPDGSLAFLAPSVTAFEFLAAVIPPFGYWVMANYTRFTAFDTSAF